MIQNYLDNVIPSLVDWQSSNGYYYNFLIVPGHQLYGRKKFEIAVKNRRRTDE